MGVYSKVIKRLLDIVFSGFLLIVLSPLFCVIIIMELAIHGKPVFYSQQRAGRYGKNFLIHKFRSMTNECDEHGVLLPGSRRLTRFGMFIRKTSLDELPELFCILKGEMSVIGPRPLLPEYTELYSSRHRRRLLVRPGLACPWIKKSEAEKKYRKYTWGVQFENDVWYVYNVSFFVDVRMFFAIIREVLLPRKDRVDDTRGKFNGRNLWD